MSVLIWDQTVFKGYQQMTKVVASKQRVKSIPFTECPSTGYVLSCVVTILLHLQYMIISGYMQTGLEVKKLHFFSTKHEILMAHKR